MDCRLIALLKHEAKRLLVRLVLAILRFSYRLELAGPPGSPGASSSPDARPASLDTYTAARVRKFRLRHLDDAVTQGSLDQPGRPDDSTYGSDTRTKL
ncbi:hypothetical protein PCANC_27269 [Puccinia coronata f. sp. avenae]|uniref:Uncharacterized protein n=1 Tax=Puccinia coronata f. sp. avenae TaxID=200324 RepID=A0A2N5TNB4_9BASI|nr:hypothetical protein PCANC_27269 [Puccinia coronata f. sp. avenae]PLW26983.1 hypothetical protein PCASD_23025 [Puccinia coronata f. sp. avenae]